MMTTDLNNSTFNTSYVETERFINYSTSPIALNSSNLNEDTFNSSLNNSYFNDSTNARKVFISTNNSSTISSNNNVQNNSYSNNINRVKKPQNVTPNQSTPQSANMSMHTNNNESFSIQSVEQFYQIIKSSKSKSQENERLKLSLRNNNWPSNHPIRKNLWKSILQLSQQTNLDKENNTIKTNTLSANETEYNKHLNQIFGKLRDVEVSLPDFVYSSNLNTNSANSAIQSPSMSTTTQHQNHFNYYFLNNKGKQAIKRILCVYEYQYPQVTFSPGLVSISSLLLHYMQEHEVFSALCFLSSTKEHLIESKSSWEITCSVFIKLLKNYCKSSYDIITKYATDPLDAIFNDWYWWIFDSLSFDYLVKIMDCYLFEGQKIFYRVSLAIVQQFSKYLEFIEDCEYLSEYILDAVKTENISVNRDSIKNFCSSSLAFESIEKLLKSSFSIRNLKRSTIRDIYLKEESKRKSLGSALQTTPPAATTTQTNASIIQTSAFNKIDSNNNIDIINNSIKKTNLNISGNEALSFDHNHTSPTRIFLDDSSTSVLSHSQLSRVKSNDSQSSQNSKSSMGNALKKISGKTKHQRQSQNAYKWSLCFVDTDLMQKSFLSLVNLCTIWNWIPQRLSVYNPKMLFTTQENGTSLNTLFNILDEHEYTLLIIKTFQNEIFGAFCSGLWAERKQKTIYFGKGETFLFTLLPEKKIYRWIGTKKQKTSPNQEMFMRADTTKIAIGGGGTDGLSINSNLIEGTTNRCDTFENEPLASTISFQIAILEAVGFGSGQN